MKESGGSLFQRNNLSIGQDRRFAASANMIGVHTFLLRNEMKSQGKHPLKGNFEGVLDRY